MAQVFHPSFNVFSKASLLGGLALLLVVGWVWARYVRSDYVTGVDQFVNQPIPFSHQHHVSGLGIDCRYCHTSVENSAFAGIPPTQICMNCHSQIWLGSDMLEPVRSSYQNDVSIAWNRVYNLPGFVYFDHSIHLKKGVGCSTCHGQVEEMPLTRQAASLYMEWCLDCHRQPEQYVRPREEVFNMHWHPPADQIEQGTRLVEAYAIQRRTDCSTCHR